ncbi:MAG TPA: hypothetical protein VEA59_01995 [Patescibacteria group bacterium]|nr:hypothetical protein [Patescibacteria group bacterium]
MATKRNRYGVVIPATLTQHKAQEMCGFCEEKKTKKGFTCRRPVVGKNGATCGLRHCSEECLGNHQATTRHD